MINRSVIFAVLSFLVSAGALFLAVRNVDFGLTAANLARADYFLVFLAFLAALSATCFTLRRWQVMLNPNPTHFARLFQAFFIANLLNSVLPAKLGVLSRVYLASEYEHIGKGYLLGTVALEEIIDSILIVALGLFLIPFVPFSDELRKAWVLTAAGALLAGGVVLLAGVQQQRTLKWFARIGRLIKSAKLFQFFSGLLESTRILLRREQRGSLWGWSVLVWIAGGLANQLLILAFHIPVSWIAAWFLLVVLQIGTKIPAAPGSIGVFHYLVVLALGVFSVEPSVAFAYAVALHMLVYVLPALIGAGLLWKAGTDWQALVRRTAD